MTRDEVVLLCNRRQRAFDEHDFDGLGALYAEQAMLQSPMAGSITGRAAVVQATRAFYAVFPDARITTEAPIIDGRQLVLVGEVAGTQIGSFMGSSPTSKPYRFRCVFLLEVEDGVFMRERRVYDFTGLLLQIGVLKAKPV